MSMVFQLVRKRSFIFLGAVLALFGVFFAAQSILAQVVPTVQFSVTSPSILESVSSGSLEVVLSATSSEEVSVEYSVLVGSTATGGGVDYTLLNGTATIPVGSTSTSVPFTIVNDVIDEVDETVIVKLSEAEHAVLGAFDQHTLTILDDDGVPSVQFALLASSQNEASSGVDLLLQLSSVSGLPVTVQYAVSSGTATGGEVDYTLLNGTATIPVGATSSTIPISIVNDVIDESNELVVLGLSLPLNATLGSVVQHALTILDNDPTPPGIPGKGFCKDISERVEDIRDDRRKNKDNLLEDLEEALQKLDERLDKWTEKDASGDPDSVSKKWEEKFLKWEDRADTPAESLAVANFETAVRAAVHARKTAANNANEDYAEALQDVYDSFVASTTLIVDAYNASLETALSKALTDCANGVDPKVVHDTLYETLRLIQEKFHHDRKALGTLQNAMKPYMEDRKEAIGIAWKTYKEAIKQARTTLRAAFGMRPLSDLDDDDEDDDD